MSSAPIHQEQLGHLLLRAHRLFAERALARLHAHGHASLRMAHVTLLPHIDAEGTRSSALGERAGITKQAAGQIIADLEEAGYVRRVHETSDARAQRVLFTRKGHELVKDAMKIKAEIDAEFVGRIGTKGLTQLRRLLVELIEEDVPRRR